MVDDGGPAFPIHGGGGGMLLRDWFAGMAVEGMLSFSSAGLNEGLAYQFADAMLAERKKEKSDG